MKGNGLRHGLQTEEPHEPDLHRIHAFTQDPFGGNPACIIPLTSWPSNSWMLRMASKMAVAETAFIVPTQHDTDADADYHLRWFTPDIEMDRCAATPLSPAHRYLSTYDASISLTLITRC
jgi:PhzF family phenazine biosynthesis protein